MTASPIPANTRLWVATSDDNDFRDETWVAQPMTTGASGFSSHALRSGMERIAVFGEVDYEFEGLEYSLSTLVYWK